GPGDGIRLVGRSLLMLAHAEVLRRRRAGSGRGWAGGTSGGGGRCRARGLGRRGPGGRGSGRGSRGGRPRGWGPRAPGGEGGVAGWGRVPYEASRWSAPEIAAQRARWEVLPAWLAAPAGAPACMRPSSSAARAARTGTLTGRRPAAASNTAGRFRSAS